MDQASTLHATLVRSVERVLAALFRLLLRHGMSFTAFESIAKRVYVDVALREFGIHLLHACRECAIGLL